MKLKLFNFTIIFLLTLLSSKILLAAVYQVEIKQVNSDTQDNKIVCFDDKKCFLPIVLELNGGAEIPIIAHLSFVPGNASFRFQSRKGFLYVGNKTGASSLIWHKALGNTIQLEEGITLYSPVVPEAAANSIIQFPVLRTTHKAIADLEITIKSVSK